MVVLFALVSRGEHADELAGAHAIEKDVAALSGRKNEFTKRRVELCKPLGGAADERKLRKYPYAAADTSLTEKRVCCFILHEMFGDATHVFERSPGESHPVSLHLRDFRGGAALRTAAYTCAGVTQSPSRSASRPRSMNARCAARSSVCRTTADSMKAETVSPSPSRDSSLRLSAGVTRVAGRSAVFMRRTTYVVHHCVNLVSENHG